MPLTLPSDNPANNPGTYKPGSCKTGADPYKGTLYVVATPIGHREDITLRAIRVLTEVKIVAAEDTRHTGRLLAHYKIKTPLIAYHDHNEARQTANLIERLKAGDDLALVSDAGTPGVSDPGYRLVTAAAAEKISVVPIPGPSALVAALSVAGLPTDRFTFIGFLPTKKAQRAKQLQSLENETITLIFYESPKRLLGLVQDLKAVLGNRPAVLAREITKLHEEFIRGSLEDIADQLSERKTIKGECTLLVAGNTDKSPVSKTVIQAALANAFESQDLPLSAIARLVADQLGTSRNQVYKEALRMQSNDE